MASVVRSIHGLHMRMLLFNYIMIMIVRPVVALRNLVRMVAAWKLWI